MMIQLVFASEPSLVRRILKSCNKASIEMMLARIYCYGFVLSLKECRPVFHVGKSLCKYCVFVCICAFWDKLFGDNEAQFVALDVL